MTAAGMKTAGGNAAQADARRINAFRASALGRRPRRAPVPGWAAALLAALLLLPAAASAQSRSRGRAAAQLRQAPPEDPDEASTDLTAPTGTLGSALTLERRSGRNGRGAANEPSTTTILGARVGLPEGFAVHTTLHAEPLDPLGLERTRLPEHAVWVETLNLRWQRGPLVVFGGKIHPRFGAAWFRVPGLYGADLAGDYELREKLGGGVELDLEDVFGLPDALGGHEFRVEGFQADTTDLSGGLFRPRWAETVTATDPATGATSLATLRHRRNSRALGGADNRPGLAGLTASLVGTGIDLPGDAGLGYSAALSLRQPGEDATGAGRGRRERGATAALFGEFGLPLGLRLLPLVEVAAQEAAGGFAGSRAAWLTGAVTLRRGPVAASLVEMRRRVSDQAAGRAFWRERAVNLTLDLGALSGLAALAPVSLSLDARRAAQGGQRLTDLAAGLVVSLSF
ncbi:hypothetical protein EAH89_19190 [Roseomonas nepalensis]|uniref:Uncharacterized protein n=1 Tax=Muricoccus nepalensis TaxID=1854500 RepID=A0A502FR43_9PROT|nr:hypothetical protein [Roseomonas nepalensis]TPG51884.1 hypothetical protein EAH89_19190 [Roseomonas nepalensis]